LIREHVPLETVPISEQFSSGQLAADLALRGIQAHAYTDTEAILDALARRCQPGDVVVILSHGGFDIIHQRLLTLLEHPAP
jgi:UDP-N-acetylmuramate-alanine ligase